MNSKSSWVSFLSLIIIVAVLPFYAVQEPARLAKAASDLSSRQIEEGAKSYVRYCAACHGKGGEGIGVMPSLNNPVLATADTNMLHETISQAAHGTTMAAWHINEGGALTDYQISELVTLIQQGDWEYVEKVADRMDYVQAPAPEVESGDAFMLGEDAADPHSCAACHEDPLVHRDRFGLSCARCHSSLAWTPAYLTRHTFFLDHGGEGMVPCTTCHAENYYTNSCYGCHDHTPEQMQEAHLAENISEYTDCVKCHPTGQSDEARQVMQGGGIPADAFSGLEAPVPVSNGSDE